MKIIFYLPVNIDKQKFVAFLVFLCTTASFIAQIPSSENVSKQDAILAPIAKQWIAKDIPSYGRQSKRAKIDIHWFGKYLKKIFFLLDTLQKVDNIHRATLFVILEFLPFSFSPIFSCFVLG